MPTLTVTTNLDQNDGNLGDGLSLREAILEANANPNLEYIINLPAGEYKLTLKNTLDAPIVDVTSVDLPTLIEQRKTTGDLDVNGNITIIGQDPSNTIIDAFDLRNSFEARLASMPIAPEEGGEDDPIPGLILNSDGSINDRGTQFIGGTARTNEKIEILTEPRSPVEGTLEFNTSTFTIGDRAIDVGNGGDLNIENVNIKNGLLVTTKEVILDLKDQDPANRKIGEIYTRTYSYISGSTEDGDPITTNVIEQYLLKDVITEKDIEAGGTISIGNVDTTPEGAGIKIGSNSNVSLENVTVEDNETESVAGAIYNDGNLSIDNSTIQGNSAFSAGGIQNNENLVVNRTSIQNNSSGLGTGIHNFGEAEVYNSLIAENEAGSNSLRILLGEERFVFPIGAGIFNESQGDLIVVNSTIYGNQGGVDLGGGLLLKGRATIVNSTIMENIGQGGAGIWANTDTSNVTLYNTIVAQNRKPNFNYYGDPLGIFYNVPDVEGFINGKSSNNYLGYGNGVLVDGVNGNIARTNVTNSEKHIDIGLGELQDNGGNTRTVSISGNSLFVDAGTNTIDNQEIESIRDYFPTFNLIDDQGTDQRIIEILNDDGTITRIGFQRIANGIVDIGAFEFRTQEISAVITPDEEGSGGNEGGGNEGSGNQEIERDNHPLDSETSNSTNQNTTNNIQDLNSESSTSTQDPLSVLDMNLFRWQNSDRPGTYLYANEQESINIEANYPNFDNEGFAFRVGMNSADDLVAFYRFHNSEVPGTYLYANATERQEILASYQNFKEEGLAFYAYDGNANVAEDVYRLHNDAQPGTYLFVNEEEKDQILANYDNYSLEGVAFEASFSQI